MISDEQAHKLLESHGVDLVGSLVRDGNDNSRVYGFIRVKIELAPPCWTEWRLG